ncbi:MAG: kelch repeat-containing protein [Byssovorax sp.]
MAVEAVLRGAADVPIELVNGLAVYRGALADGADVIHRVREDGTEDFVAFATKPDREEIVYDVDVSRAAGLRLVASTLELLDAGGAPRLRVSPPSVEDASGEHIPASLAVVGCHVDTLAAPPWNRPITAPCGVGASSCSCEVHVRWSDAHVRYPAIVDPAWTAAGNLATPRSGHVGGVLHDGTAFVVGGRNAGTDYLASMELYHAGSGTWAAGAPMAVGRSHLTATVLDDGRVLVAGGRSDVVFDSAEIYDVAGATWSPTGSLAFPRQFHTATLTKGRVLVTGGLGGIDPGGVSRDTAELYDPAAGAWSSAGKMASHRAYHVATALDDANQRVLITGGYTGSNPPTFHVSADIYDPVMKAWTAAAPMSTGRDFHTATLVAPGQVVVTGGQLDIMNHVTDSVEIYDVAKDMWAAGPALVTGRRAHCATLLGDGHLLVLGGTDLNAALKSAEVLVPDGLAWLPAGAMAHPARVPTAVRLGPSDVLVAGGDASLDSVAFAELFHELASPQPCMVSGECASGLCAAGVCCDKPCNETCLSCTAAGKGGGVDGVCEKAAGNPCKEYTCTASGSCKTSCTANADCTTGNVCLDGACVSAADLHCDGDHTIVGNDRSSHSCGLARCSTTTNECIPKCLTTSANCIEGASCGPEDVCVSDAPIAPPAAGCGCVVPRRRPTGGEWLIGSAALAIALGARRRGRRLARRGR